MRSITGSHHPRHPDTGQPGVSGLGPRLALGIVQGVLLYGLYREAASHSDFARQSLLFVPLVLAALLVPPLAVVGTTQLRWRRLLLWCALLAAVVAVLGYHDAWRQLDPAARAAGQLGILVEYPSARAVLAASAILFIAFALILAGESAGRAFAPYPAYFRLSWKLGLQLHLAGLFAAVLYLVLWAGAALFMLVKLDFLQVLLRQSWFNIPVVAMAFAAGLHLTDVRDDFIRGVRTLVLTLLAWILPVLVLIVAGFLLTLAFRGLAPLWATRHAGMLMLAVIVLQVVLVNAVFKSGQEDEALPRALRWSARAACLTLAPLAAIAAYALALRIAQYGLSERRVLMAACLAVALCYAIGYAWAALGRGAPLQRLAPVNVLTAWVMLAVLAVLFTPLADPARLAVSSQVARLIDGRVAPQQFDFSHLRSTAYGRQALARLQAETAAPQAAAIRALSAQAAQQRGPDGTRAPQPAPDAAAIAANLDLRTPGRAVPPSFLANDWQQVTPRWRLPACLTSRSMRCDAYVLALTAQETPNVVLFPGTHPNGSVFGQDAGGAWRLIATVNIGPDCAAVREALAHGTFRLAPPVLPDIEVGGRRLQLEDARHRGTGCKP
ncbi:DUF4153 domain-containing protein [Cupriavidus necator]|uniref:DUF4153 domain-containing protein n=1 Tax=Cupriavidus necator TaxID=106590 RepID=UPI0039C2141F